jgi:hypothetical protein
VDSSRRFHRDVSFALALAVFAAGAARTCASVLCDAPDCAGEPPLMLLFSPESRAWNERHPSPTQVAARQAAEAAVDAEDAEVAALASEEDEREERSIAARVAELARAGFSQVSQMGVARDARRAIAERDRAERIAAHQQAQSDAKAAQTAAQQRKRDAQRLERAARRSVGWFPGDSL